MKLKVVRDKTAIYPDNKRVIARFFFTTEQRAEALISKVLAMPEEIVQTSLNQILRESSNRYRSVTSVYKRNYNRVKDIVNKLAVGNDLSEWRKLLIGAYFTMEYAVESAALFNPSIVKDPDQSGLGQGEVRVILSLRATGEGHISSLVFRRAVINENNEIHLEDPGFHVAEAAVIKNYLYEKKVFTSKLNEMGIPPDFYKLVLDRLPDKFTYDQIREIITTVQEDEEALLFGQQKAAEELLWLADSYTEIKFSLDTDISERIIFPISRFERNGIEDARFTKFTTKKSEDVYYGVYTAYDGYNILPKLIETRDFYTFKVFPLHGNAAVNKNLALFPRKIKGKYAMIGRIDGVSNYIMYSTNLNKWNDAVLLQEPLHPWELVQIGNGGSPIETEKGWLLITHGVGPMRTYSLGACLLDLENPEKIIGRLKEPLLVPFVKERAGYVPNVVYSCGAYVHNGILIIPYSMNDFATSFASVPLDKVLEALTLEH
jgi:predicted GH43/DUF377 family glycosyl hydrolase